MIYLFVSSCDIRKPNEKYTKQEPQRTCCSLSCASFSSRVLTSRSSLCRSCSQRTRSCSSLFFSSISSFCQNWSLSVAFISCSGITLQSPPFDQRQSVKIVIYINVPFFLRYTPAICCSNRTCVSFIVATRLIKFICRSCRTCKLLHNHIYLYVIFGARSYRYMRTLQQSLYISDMIRACSFPNDWSTFPLL